MKLLVLGANSQLGQALTKLLDKQKVDYSALSTDELDVLNQADLVKTFARINPTQVINVAAYSNLEKSETDPEASKLCEQVNAEGVSTLSKVCDNLNLPLLHHSTSYVFDGEKHHPYNEEDEANPVCRYGLSRWYGERAIRESLTRYIILRTDWLFSPYRNEFFKVFIEACKDNKGKIDVAAHRYSPTPAEDVARVILAITHQVDCNAQPWGTYHYASLQSVTQEQFVESFLHEASRFDTELKESIKNLEIAVRPVEKPYITNTTLECQKIMETFGIKQRSRAAGVQSVLESLYKLPE